MNPRLARKPPSLPRLSLSSAVPCAACAPLSLALAAFVFLGCGPASGGDPHFWEPAPGADDDTEQSTTSTSASSEGGGDPGTTTQQASQPTLAVRFTTATFGGKYSPDNVGAVWVEDAAGLFVKTLRVWGTKRIKYVVKWKAISAGNTVDAVTGATRSSHGPIESTWDLTDVNGALVPDGPYRVLAEMTEHNAAGVWAAIDFEKGPSPVEAAPTGNPYFLEQHLSFEPGE